MKIHEKICNGVLAVFLLVTVFLFGYKTISENFMPLFESARAYPRLINYMPAENYTFLEHTTARIRSFEDKFNEVLWKKAELGYMNSTLQYSLGKDMINTGASSTVTLPGGYLYDLPAYVDTSNQTSEIIDFFGGLDVPALFVFEHPTTYGENNPTGGYAMLDYGFTMSDEIVSSLRGAGVNVLDSRDILSGEALPDILWYTDQHWTYYAALAVAQDVAYEVGLDGDMLEPTLFERMVFEQKFLGKYGQQVGPGNIDPDDIVLYWPMYETSITRFTILNGEETTVSGPFKDSVIKWEHVNVPGWSVEAYKAYGLTEDFEHYHNEGVDNGVTLLIFKDSYGSPVGAFLSLVAEDVYLVDMRKQEQYAPYFVEMCDPDYVIVSYSRQMLSLNEYDLLEGY